jgi:hypothetical protein
MKEILESALQMIEASEECQSPQCRISYYTDIQYLMIKFDKELRKHILNVNQDVYKEWVDREMSNRVKKQREEDSNGKKKVFL